VAEAHPRVIAYTKNQGMQFEVPYRNGTQHRRYGPDYIVRIYDGGPEPLNLIVEVKGFRGIDAQLKAETMRKLWVPGVNKLPATVAGLLPNSSTSMRSRRHSQS
jgi:type III restriction enzyme